MFIRTPRWLITPTCVALLIVLGTRSPVTATSEAQAHTNVEASSVRWGLDPTFGDGGIVRLPAGTVNSSQFLHRPDGKLVALTRQYEVAKFGYNLITSTAYLINSVGNIELTRTLALHAKGVLSDNTLLLDQARYDTNLNNVDSGFYARGEASFPNTFGSRRYFVQTDDKILVAGEATDIVSGTVSSSLQLRRLNSNGTVDIAFGTVTLSNTNPYGVIGFDPSGRIVVANNAIAAGVDNVYSVTGSLLGSVLSSLDGPSFYTSWYTPDPTGSFVWFATQATTPPSRIGHIYRSNGNNGLDQSFGSGGAVTVTLPISLGWANDNFAVLVKSNGAIVLVGKATGSTANLSNKIIVVGINVDGSPDTSFGPQGYFFVEPALNTAQIDYDDIRVRPIWRRAQSIFLTDDGKIVIAGIAEKTPFESFEGPPTVIRLAPFTVRSSVYLPTILRN